MICGAVPSTGHETGTLSRASRRFSALPNYFHTARQESVATFFTTLTGVVTDFAKVGHHLSSYMARHPELELSHVLLQGVAESLAPAILGFTLLSLTALLVTVGLYREPLT